MPLGGETEKEIHDENEGKKRLNYRLLFDSPLHKIMAPTY